MVGDISGVLSHPSIPQPVKIISQAQMCNNEMSKEKKGLRSGMKRNRHIRLSLVTLDSLIKFTMLGNLSLPFLSFFFSLVRPSLGSSEMKFEIKFKSYQKFNDQIKKKTLMWNEILN